MEDNKILQRIKDLMEEEESLYSRGGLDEGERKRLHDMKIELDQCWDLLRQRRALREFGKNPDDARMRPPGTIENYEQ
jgi:hypothetical protein